MEIEHAKCLHPSTPFIGQWQCDWGWCSQSIQLANVLSIMNFPSATRRRQGLGSRNIFSFFIYFSSSPLSAKMDKLFFVAWVWHSSCDWVCQNQLSPTHTTRPQKAGGEKSGEYGYFPQDTVQFAKCMIGFFHIVLQPAHRSFRKVSQKLAEKTSEGESPTMMVAEIAG